MNANWMKQMIFLEVLLAIVAAALIFTSLDVVSGGLLLSVLAVAGFLILLGLANYFLWGRRALGQQCTFVFRQAAAAPEDDIVISLSEQERTELLRLLNQTLSAGPAQRDTQRTALDRQLAEKLRMFGA